MSPDKVWGVFELYKREIPRRFKIAPTQMTTGEYASPAVSAASLTGHCAWMADQVLNEFKPRYAQAVADGNESEARSVIEKAMRWLGYVQGVMNALGVYCCDDLKEHSRTGGVFVPVDTDSPEG